MSFVYTFGGNVVQAANQGYNDIVYNANVQLAWPTQFQDVLDVTAAVLYFSPEMGGLTVTLPDAELASIGQVLLIVNHTAFNTTLHTFSAGQTFPVNAGTAQIFILRNNSTQDGNWDVLPAGGGVVAVTSVGAITFGVVTSANLIIAGSPITSAGTFTFVLAGDLFALANFGAGTGIAVRTGVEAWALRTITGTPNQITVVNGNGVAGNPTISLPTIITGINNLTVADLNFSNNVITTTVANQNLLLTPNGNGDVVVDNTSGVDVALKIMHGGEIDLFGTNNVNIFALTAGNRTTTLTVTLPTTDPALGQAPIVTSLGAGTAALSWATIATSGAATTVNAVARYLNTSGSLNNSVVLLDDFGNLTGINSAIIGNMLFGTSAATTISTSVGALVLSPNGVSPVQTSSDFQITNGHALTLFEPLIGGTNVTSFSCPDLPGVDLPYVLPAAIPTPGQIIYMTSTAGGSYHWSWGNAPTNPNLLMNGSMLIWQRNTTFNSGTFAYPNNNDTYTADRWNLQSNGNNIVTVSRQTVNLLNPLAASPYALRSTIVAANTKFGYVQVFNYADTTMIAGRTVMLQLWNATAGINLIRAAFIAWTGTADVPLLTGGNFITAWNAQGADPTLAANWAYVAPYFSVNTAAPLTLSVLGPTTINTAGINNLALFAWCDSTGSAATSTWDMTCVKVEFGTVATTFSAPNFALEQQNCMSYFQKDVNYDIAIGTANVLSAQNFFVGNLGTIANANVYCSVTFSRPFNNVPVVKTYPVVTPATANAWTTGNTDLATQSAAPFNISKTLFSVQNNCGAPIASLNYTIQGHWYADGDF